MVANMKLLKEMSGAEYEVFLKNVVDFIDILQTETELEFLSTDVEQPSGLDAVDRDNDGDLDYNPLPAGFLADPLYYDKLKDAKALAEKSVDDDILVKQQAIELLKEEYVVLQTEKATLRATRKAEYQQRYDAANIVEKLSGFKTKPYMTQGLITALDVEITKGQEIIDTINLECQEDFQKVDELLAEMQVNREERRKIKREITELKFSKR